MVLKAPCASSVQRKDVLDEARAERGEAMELKPLMKGCSCLRVPGTGQEVTAETLAGSISKQSLTMTYPRKETEGS
jgi:hypothetical protein